MTATRESGIHSVVPAPETVVVAPGILGIEEEWSVSAIPDVMLVSDREAYSQLWTELCPFCTVGFDELSRLKIAPHAIRSVKFVEKSFAACRYDYIRGAIEVPEHNKDLNKALRQIAQRGFFIIR